MKQNLLLILSFLCILTFAQEPCAYDAVQRELEKAHPEVKKKREDAEARLLGINAREYLNKIGATSKNSLYTGTIYEIPVVVHVIESSSASNSSLTLTDAQIKKWIDNCNKMYATTYGNGFFPEGNGPNGGNVIPFKLSLAKRTPLCTTSTGIVRYNGSTLAGYDSYGVKRYGSSGPTTDNIKTIAPHWPENSYFNIYIVIGFDGDKSTSGLMGWAGFPTNPDSAYESFMKVAVVTIPDDSTLAHEFGHSLGLDHPFNGTSTQPTSPQISDCPVNNNCATDNDKVCDTEPTACLLNVFPVPSNNDINPCTSSTYQGIQYNIMNYTDQPAKFTSGQRDRGIIMFLQYRGNLINSLGSTDMASNPGGGTLVASNCNPSGIVNPGDFGMGPTRVQLANIDNSSSAYSATSSPQYYIDYSKQNCTTKTVYTDINPGPNQLSVSFGTNPQYIKAWIDYNNNGVFETTELIGTSGTQLPASSSPYVITFIPPATAVKNTYLRMRVIVDYTNDTACQNMSYGQTEDYSVRIPTKVLNTSDNNNFLSDSFIVYSHDKNSLILVTSKIKKFGNYEIYDMSGKLVQKGNADGDEIKLNFYNKEVYILTFTDKGKKVSKKFIQ